MKFVKKIFSVAILAALACGSISAQKVVSKSAHSDMHKQLLANQTNTKDQIKLVEKNTFIDLIDDVEPELDIYTEGWNSKAVNPFKESDVPNSAVIDVTGYYLPVPGRVTSNYGYRAKFGRMHKGIDLAIRSNDTIYAAFDGKVRLTNYEARGYGNYIIIRHPNGLETVYGHLNKHLVKPDQVVRAGEPIGLGGSTGRSTGPHLHWETRYMGYAINPQAIADIPNRRTFGNTYAFSKSTYTQAASGKPYTASTTPASYIVRQGDTLSSIARSNGLALRTLLSLNGLKESDEIHPGQTLKLK